MGKWKLVNSAYCGLEMKIGKRKVENENGKSRIVFCELESGIWKVESGMSALGFRIQAPPASVGAWSMA